MGFHLRGYTFLCDQGFGSYGQNKFWVQYIKYRRVQRDRRARVRGRPPAGAYSTSHDLRGHVIRVYPHLSAFIRMWGTAFIRVCTASVTSCCDVMHLVCTASNSKTSTPRLTSSDQHTLISNMFYMKTKFSQTLVSSAVPLWKSVLHIRILLISTSIP